jgi:uncharacterized protein YrrD
MWKGGGLLLKADDVIGLPVIDISHGKQIGKVVDILFDTDWQLQGILLELGNWFHKDRYIPISDICAFGDDAVTIHGKNQASSLNTSDMYRLATGNNKVKGLPVLTVNGHQLGMVEDVYFMEEVGTIIGYELSDGFISDIREGRRMLKRPERTTFGEDAIIVPIHTSSTSKL